MNQRGQYGNDRYIVGAEPVELSSVKAGTGIWLGFLAFVGWSIGRGIDAGIEGVAKEVRKPWKR